MDRALLLLALIAVAGLALSGCTASSHATAPLYRVTGHGSGVGTTVFGYANFTEDGDALRVSVEVFALDQVPGFEPGPKGTHIHENGDCSLTFQDGATTPGGAAGGHFNPANVSHPQHAGDLGNMVVDGTGHGILEATVQGLGLADVVGRAVVVHAGEDDLESQPAGAAGPRMLCGVVTA